MSVILLPNGEQTFLDADGNPLAGGSVGMYIPNTLTFKNTWQDQAHTVLNQNPIPLDAAGRAIIWGQGTYRQIVRDVFGVQQWDQLTSGSPDGAVGPSVALVPSVSALRALAVDSSLVGTGIELGGQYVLGDGGSRFFYLTNVSPGADNGGTIVWSSTTGFYWAQLGLGIPALSAEGFGAKPDGATDASAVLTTLLAQGLPVSVPTGTFKASNVIDTDNGALQLAGAGINKSILSKFSSDANPIMSIGDNTFTYYLGFNNLTFLGNGAKTHNGLTWIEVANSTTDSLSMQNNSVGFDAQGVLISQHYNLNLLGNTIGYRARKSGSTYSNRMSFYGGQWNGNSQWAMDWGEGQGLLLLGPDVEGNGTTGVPATTGGIIIRGTIDDEAGVGQVVIQSLWEEANLGTSLLVENCPGGYFRLSNSAVYSPENHHAITIGAVNQVILDNVLVPGSGDLLDIGATGSSLIIGGFAAAFSDLSTIKTYINAFLGGTFYPLFCNGAVVAGAISSDRNHVTAGDSSATTIGVAKAGGTRVDVWITGTGTQYCGNANVVCDGTNAAIRGSSFGANVTITLSGLNIQVTQTSGISQSVEYSIQRFGDAAP